jgi:hypothetical protein
MDLFSAIQKKVFITELGRDAPAIVTDLVLYDPDVHKLVAAATGTEAGAGASETRTKTGAGAGGDGSVSGSAAPAAAGAAASGGTTKVYADPFLVEKLRPHQRDGLK